MAVILYQHFQCMLGKGKINDLSLRGKESYEMLKKILNTHVILEAVVTE